MLGHKGRTRMPRARSGVASGLLVLVSLSNAYALDARRVDAIANAAAAFVALAPNSATTGKPPRQSDPAAKPLLDLVFDTTEVTRHRIPWDQLLTLNKWNLAVIDVGLVYMLAGTGARNLDELNSKPAADAIVDRNTVTFAPELGRYFDAQLRIQGAIMDTVQEFLRTAQSAQLESPQFKSAVAQIRSGVAQTLTGMFGTFSIEGVTDDWRRGRLTVANASAPKVAKFLVREQKVSVRAAVLQVADKMSDVSVKSGLLAFAKTLDAR